MRPVCGVSFLFLVVAFFASPVWGQSDIDENPSRSAGLAVSCSDDSRLENGRCVSSTGDAVGARRALIDCNRAFDRANSACDPETSTALDCTPASERCKRTCQNLAVDFPAIASSLNAFAFTCQSLQARMTAPKAAPVVAAAPERTPDSVPTDSHAPEAEKPVAATSRLVQIHTSGSGFGDGPSADRNAPQEGADNDQERPNPNLEKYLPGAELAPRGPHAAVISPGIHGPDVNLWNQISSRLEERCKLGRLFECQ